MAAPSLRAVAVRSGPLATLAPSCLAAAWAPLLQCADMPGRGAAAFSSSSSAAAAAGGGGSSGPDAFTAALQQKTEEELRQLALKQAQPDVADEAEAAAGEGQQAKVSAEDRGLTPLPSEWCCHHLPSRQSWLPPQSAVASIGQ